MAVKLSKDGKCFGHAKLTIVSTPRFDYRFGSEFVRINIDAALRQLQNNGNYKGRLNAIYTPEDGDGSLYEKDQIEHSFKWSPVKVYEKLSPRSWTIDRMETRCRVLVKRWCNYTSCGCTIYSNTNNFRS